MTYPRSMPARRSSPDPERSVPTDDALVAGCLAGDGRAWAALIGRYAAYVHAIASRAFGLGPIAAEEVFADVCIRLYDGLAGYAGTGEFRSWIRAVALSACREFLRGEARRAARTTEPPEPTAELEEIEAALDVRAAVVALGEPCSETIALYFFADLTQAEVATRLGVPPGTVAARLSRCLRRLRGALQESETAPTSRG